jgi:hypothetical protein
MELYQLWRLISVGLDKMIQDGELGRKQSYFSRSFAGVCRHRKP